MLSIDEHFGRQLRRRRKLAGLTQKQVAGAVGVRFQQIQKYECGASRMSAAMIWKLACTLGAPVDYFFEGLVRHKERRIEEEFSDRAVG